MKLKKNLKFRKEIKIKIIQLKVKGMNQIPRQNKRTIFFYWTTHFPKQEIERKERNCYWIHIA
jgi:hypothetical protein